MVLSGWSCGTLDHLFTVSNTLICLVSHGNSPGSRLDTVSDEAGVVITRSRTGTGETDRLRIDPNRWLRMKSKVSRMRYTSVFSRDPCYPPQKKVVRLTVTHLPIP